MTGKNAEIETSEEREASECSDLLCCDLCGGKMVYIRGRHPGMDNRIVCPTCMAETLDDIKGRLRDDTAKHIKQHNNYYNAKNQLY